MTTELLKPPGPVLLADRLSTAIALPEVQLLFA
jgi:hypothetical protein